MQANSGRATEPVGLSQSAPTLQLGRLRANRRQLRILGTGRLDIAGVFMAGGVVGSVTGTKISKRLSGASHLTSVFAGLIFVVTPYMIWKSGAAAF
jgi:hypothetical protein